MFCKCKTEKYFSWNKNRPKQIATLCSRQAVSKYKANLKKEFSKMCPIRQILRNLTKNAQNSSFFYKTWSKLILRNFCQRSKNGLLCWIPLKWKKKHFLDSTSSVYHQKAYFDKLKRRKKKPFLYEFRQISH